MLKHYTATLTEKNVLAPNVLQLWFDLVDDTLEFKSGQYILLEVGNGFRQYSIASSPQFNKKFELLIDTTPMGIGSQYLMNLALGDHIHFRAPLGVFVLHESNLPKLFLATGSGIAPMKSMLEFMHEMRSPQKRILLWGTRTFEQAYYTDIWKKLGRMKGFDYTFCLSKGDVRDHCSKGYIQDALNDIFLHNSPQSFEYYVCARPTIVESLKQYLAQKSVPESNIFHEKFT
ncbi:MAG: FAD-binding oxidoreductase [Candidatus Roizmanbacteria bacterium]|nr:FAD-binding oxidoreductase [Candidatus Roizmanbacteria bacterium]